MSPETCRKRKAFVILAILSVSEGRRVSSRILLSGSQPYGPTFNADGGSGQDVHAGSEHRRSATQGHVRGTTAQVESSRAHPIFQKTDGGPTLDLFSLAEVRKSSSGVSFVPLELLVGKPVAGASRPVASQVPQRHVRMSDPKGRLHRLTAPSPLERSRPPLMGDSGFSELSYYTTLALFVLSFPGIYSLVKRSVKSKIVRKTYEVAGPAAPGGRPTREVAGDIVAYFQANNYKIAEAADTIVFEGLQQSLNGRAAFLTFCTFVSFAAFALVLTIFEQGAFGEGNGLGSLWYLSTLVSPLAGKYYLDNAERTEQVTVKIITEDDEMSSDIVVQGDDEEIERLQKTLDLREKGMVYVKGILE